MRRFVPLLLVLLLGAGYFATLLPGIGHSGDTIKFQYIGKILGVPHEPGYPLYTVLNHLFVTVLPFGSTAYKANLLSAVYAVGACVMLFKLLQLFGVGRVVASVSALAFGFSKEFWSQAVVAEVYTLLIFFMAAVSYFLIKWHLKRRDRDFYIAVALYALSFGNHLLAITLLPASVFLVVATDKQVFAQPKKLFWVFVLVTLGALQYSYLWWRLTDPQTLYIEGLTRQNFFYFVTGGRFKPLIFAFTPAEVLTQRIPVFLEVISNNQPVLIVIAAIGTFVGRMTWPVRAFLLIYFFGNAFYAVNYDIPDFRGYFLANDFVVAIFASVALERFVQWRPRRQQRWVLGLLCIIPLAYYVTRYSVVDRSGSVRQSNVTETVLQTVGKDAVLLYTDYQTGQGLLYYLLAEGKGEADNLYAVYFKSSVHRLQAYLDEEETLGRRVPLGLTLYAYPCPKQRIAELGLRTLETSSATPQLCKLEDPRRTPRAKHT